MRKLLVAIVILLVLGGAAYAWAVSAPEIEAIEPPDPASFDPELVSRGRTLALIGNCNECHNAEGGEPYAGGRPVESPYGVIYSTNITPDPETGIGRWSPEAFARSMREGLDREGGHLYPAFPYPHYRLLRDEDIEALYAFLMTRRPVRAEAPESELPFPFNIRPILAGWNLLFLEEGRFVADPSLDEPRNTGAYLVRGLGHCGACHTPRNLLQAEERDRFLMGGENSGWHAPALVGAVPAAVPWTEEAMTGYLRREFVEGHGIGLGPMEPVTRNLSRVPEEAAVAMAAYITGLAGPPDPGAGDRAERVAERSREPIPTGLGADPGAHIYAGACARCHEHGTPDRLAFGIELAYSASLRLPDARNLVHVIRNGVKPPPGEAGFYMPGFDGALTDDQIVALAAFLRARFTDLPPWENLEDTVAGRDLEEDETGQAILGLVRSGGDG